MSLTILTQRVLDNCEHLLEECAELVDRLLRTCARLNIVATSRQALRVAGEIAWPVPTLQSPDTTRPTTTAEVLEFAATRLFVERASAIQPDFALADEHSPAVATICRRLDGLPLAIELAAARVNALGLQQIVQRLDNRFRLLVHGSRTAPRCQQTLRATIDWSYELLSEPERLLFDRLAVFADGWTLEAAEIVASGDEVNDADVVEHLSQLVDKSLVVAELGKGGAMRYRFLETLREYGNERLAARNETQRVARRHAEFFLALAERADKELRGPGMRAWLDRLEIEQNNLRAALSRAATHADDLTGLQLAGALGLFWMSRRYWSEGLRWLELFLARPECAPRTGARAHALHYAGLLAGHRNDFSTAQARVEEGAAIARELNVSGPISGLGWFRGFRGDHIAAGELQREDVRLAQRSGDQFSEALALQMLGVVLLQHDRVQSLIALNESARLFRQVGNPWGTGMALNGLGDLARWEGDYPRARELYEQSLACFRDAQSDTERSVLQNLGYVAHRQGDHREAAEFILNALAQFVREGDHRGTAECFVALGGVAVALGRPERAARLFGAADRLLKTIDADLTPLCRTEYELDLSATRAQLHPESFARFWAEGETLPLERVLVEASTVATIETVRVRPEDEASHTAADSLTEREREVLDLLGRGLSTNSSPTC